MPDQDSLGHVMLSKLNLHPDSDTSDKTRLKCEKYIIMGLAGVIAEEKFTKTFNTIGASGDFQECFKVAAILFGPPELINTFMDFMCVQTKSMFTFFDEKNRTDSPAWEMVKCLSKELLKNQNLTYKEVQSLLKNK